MGQINVHLMSRVRNFEEKMTIKILNIEIKHVYQQITTMEHYMKDKMRNIGNILTRATLGDFQKRQQIQ